MHPVFRGQSTYPDKKRDIDPLNELEFCCRKDCILTLEDFENAVAEVRSTKISIKNRKEEEEPEGGEGPLVV